MILMRCHDFFADTAKKKIKKMGGGAGNPRT